MLIITQNQKLPTSGLRVGAMYSHAQDMNFQSCGGAITHGPLYIVFHTL